MSDKKTKHDVSKVTVSVQTLEEFEELLKLYKVKSPAKYAFKNDNGEFDRKRVALGGKPKKANKPEKEEEPKAEKPKEEKPEKEVKKEKNK